MVRDVAVGNLEWSAKGFRVLIVRQVTGKSAGPGPHHLHRFSGCGAAPHVMNRATAAHTANKPNAIPAAVIYKRNENLLTAKLVGYEQRLHSIEVVR
jgi:hypothetical protein